MSDHGILVGQPDCECGNKIPMSSDWKINGVKVCRRCFVLQPRPGSFGEAIAKANEAFSEPDPVDLGEAAYLVMGSLNYNCGAVVKYTVRADKKGMPIRDLEKAAWYIQREIKRRRGL